MPPEADTSADWLALAARELAFLSSIGDEYPEQVLFHCQQVVEKSLKAVLALDGGQPPFSHSLETLAARIPADRQVPESLMDALWLSEIYIVSRYYADEPTPDAAQVVAGRAAAGVAVDWARDQLAVAD